MSKKLLSLLMAGLLSVGMLAGCTATGGTGTTESTAPSENGADQQETPIENATNTNDGKTTLVMATEATFPPYEYMEGDQVVGVDVDIATEIAKEMGMELKVETMNFDAVIPAVNSGKADFGAAGMSITEDRLKEVDFSIEYATSTQVILTTADSGITSEADLAGKKIGVQMGNVSDIVLSEDYPDVELIRAKKYTDLSMDLQNGNIDAIVLDSLPAKAIQKTSESFVILEEPLFSDVYAICVKKGNQEMLDAINTTLERLIAEGKVDEFTIKHLGE